MSGILRRKGCCCGTSGLVCPIHYCDTCADDSPWIVSAGGFHKGQFKFLFDGVTLGTSVTGLDYHSIFSFDTLGNPTFATTGYSNNNYIWNLTSSDRNKFTVAGTMPTEFWTDAEDGWCFSAEYRDYRKVNNRGSAPDAVQDFVPGSLAQFGCHGAGFTGSLLKRETYKGDWTPTGTPWPYAIPTAGGKTPMLVEVAYSLDITSATDMYDVTRLTALGTSSVKCYYHQYQVYPTWTGGGQNRACEGEMTTMEHTYVWFKGQTILLGAAPSSSSSSSTSSSSSGSLHSYPEVFPCSRESWVFTNTLTLGAAAHGTAFAIASGGTLTVSPLVDEGAGALTDAVDEYELSMTIGPPKALVLDTGITSYGPPTTTGQESLDITLKRYKVTDFNIPDLYFKANPVAVWYGEDDNYKAKLEYYVASAGTTSALYVEKKELWSGGQSPRVLQFINRGGYGDTSYGVGYSPPECSPSNPTYTLMNGNPKGGGCAPEPYTGFTGGLSYIPTPTDNWGFTYTVPTLSRTGGSILAYPQSPRDDGAICDNQYLICWKSDGSKAFIKKLAPTSSSSSSSSTGLSSSSSSSSSFHAGTPTDPLVDSRCDTDYDRSAIVTKDACICYAFGGGIICPQRWYQPRGTEYDAETDTTNDVGDDVTLQSESTARYPYVSAPDWYLAIQQECPPRYLEFWFPAVAPDEDGELCPPLGEWGYDAGLRTCEHGVSECFDCFHCENAPSSFFTYVVLSESAAGAYWATHDDAEELPYLKVPMSGGSDCSWGGTDIENTFDENHYEVTITLITNDPRTSEPFANGQPHFYLKAILAGDGETSIEALAPCSVSTSLSSLDSWTIYSNNLYGYEGDLAILNT